MNFFANELGGNPMLYINLIWIWDCHRRSIFWSACFGIYSVVSTFCGNACSATQLDGVRRSSTILSLSGLAAISSTMGSGAKL